MTHIAPNTQMLTSASHTLTIPGLELAAPIRLSHQILKDQNIRVIWHDVSYKDYAIDVTFRVNLGLIADYDFDEEFNFQDVENILTDFAEDKLVEIGIPTPAHHSVNLMHTEMESYVDIDCRLFIESNDLKYIDPEIRMQVQYTTDEWCVIVGHDFVLNAILPSPYTSVSGAPDEEKITNFRKYIQSIIPWHMQWLTNYTFFIEDHEDGTNIIFNFLPLDLEEFHYEEPTRWPHSDLLLYEYTVHPQIQFPKTNGVQETQK